MLSREPRRKSRRRDISGICAMNAGAQKWHGFCLSELRARALSRAIQQRILDMLYWAAVFFVIALLAAVFGFGGIAASAVGVAKILFFVFLILAIVSLIFGRRVPT